MKKKALLVCLPLLLAALPSCGTNKGSKVSIIFDGEAITSQNAIDGIKESLVRNNHQFVEKDGEYNISISLDSSLGEQGYSVAVDGKNITVKGGDATGVLYGAYQVAEEIDVNGLKNVSSSTGTPYLKDRGFRLNPLMDLRTPCYTANADSTRANFENTWDLSYWEDLFKLMSKMRYNLFDFSVVCAFPQMVKVEGYEDCALDDIWVYDGEYDDTYYGNCTNMFREEHMADGNYHVYKKMTIDEKIEHWKKVIELCHSYGMKFQYDTMNIYTFWESHTKYGITDDRANTVTRDYYHKSVEALLNTYDIDMLKITAGENMDYPSGTEMETEQWIYDTYGQAAIDAYGKREDKKDFVFIYSINEENWPLWKDYPFARCISSRYANTHMYAVTKPIYTKETRDALPDGTYDLYNLRNEDAYHFTWADPKFAREFCKNMKDPKSSGFVMGSAGYYMGKEYEFNDSSLNGDYYYSRHWINYCMFGRFSYNPELDDSWLESLIYDHYRDSERSSVKNAWNILKTGSKWLTEFQKLFYLGGTDSSWYPETCQSHSTMGGYLGIKKFINSDNAYEGSNNYSFAKYAKAVAAGNVDSSLVTPFQVAEHLRTNAEQCLSYISSYNSAKANSIALDNIVEDQKTVTKLAYFYSYKIDAAMNLRLYNDTKDESYKSLALEATDKVISYWNEYSDAFLARFKAERFARVGVVDPSSYKDAVAEDRTVIEKWKCRTY